MRKLSTLLIALSLASTVPSLPVYAQDAPAIAAIPVTVEYAQKDRFISIIKEVGKVQAIDSADLIFNASEKIKAIHFQDGDSVIWVDLIAELDSTKAKADLDKSRSTLNLAKNKLQRSLNLVKRQPGALPPQDLDELRENVKLAAADVKQKRSILNDYIIVAPFDGRLTDFTQSVGSHIEAATPLVSLYKLNPVKVVYSISQDDLGVAYTGQTVDVRVPAFKNTVFHGTVNYIAPAVDATSGRVEVHAKVANASQSLAPGMFANVTQHTQDLDVHIIIPQNAVIAADAKRYVWIVDDNNTVKKQEVTLGKNIANGKVIVESGLKAGEKLVTTGQQSLTDGATIKVIKPVIKPQNTDK